jgi:CheY-like chemotaxis protein
VDPRGAVLTGLHILVVEDNRDARAILRILLQYYGALVTEATSGGDAVRTLQQVVPDVVVADMLLGAEDALLLLRDARKRGFRAPFIAVSAQDFDVEQLVAAGFEAYLRKPVDHQRLIDTILAVIGHR